MLFCKGDLNAPDSKYTLILNTFIHEFIKASQQLTFPLDLFLSTCCFAVQFVRHYKCNKLLLCSQLSPAGMLVEQEIGMWEAAVLLWSLGHIGLERKKKGGDWIGWEM